MEILDSENRIVKTYNLAPNQGRLAAGTILGRRSADRLLGPYASTVLAAAAAAGATTITVRNAANFRVRDAIVVGPESHTITAISGNTITLAAGLSAARAAGTVVEVTDGRQKAFGILLDEADTTGRRVKVGVLRMGSVRKGALIGDADKADPDLKVILLED